MNPQVPEQDSLKLKSYFQVGIGVGLFVALVSGFVWFKGSRAPDKTEVAEATAETPEDNGPDARFDDDLEAKAAGAEAGAVEKKKAEPVDIAKASEFFGQSLKQMSQCVGTGNQNNGERLEPSIDNLLATVKNDLGDPILRSEDWVTWNMKASGEERRIRIETDYSDSDQSSRHLLYFKVGPDGQPTLIPLPSEQTKDPSESFIASLQKDGEVYEEEKGERAYFENGQEMVLTEKNGKIDDLEFSNGSKTFRCAGILTTSPSCKCY